MTAAPPAAASPSPSALAGRRILVTRAPHQAAELSRLLRDHAAIPVEVPVLAIAPPEDFAPLDAALHTLATFDWIVFTSANAVRAFTSRAAELGLPLAVSASIAAIGRATAAAAHQAGFSVALIPAQSVAESLAAALAPQVTGKRVLLVRAAIARDVVPDALHAAGADLVLAEAYRNVIPQSSIPLLAHAAGQAAAGQGTGQVAGQGTAGQEAAQPIDAAIFTSSSSVTHLAALAAAAQVPFPLPGVPAVSIGPITSATLREHHWPPAAEAATADLPALVAALASLFVPR